MGSVVKCPACGFQDFDLAQYESMMVLNSEYALFAFKCPHCSTRVSSICAVPDYLQAHVREEALRLNCGMGHEAPSSL